MQSVNDDLKKNVAKDRCFVLSIHCILPILKVVFDATNTQKIFRQNGLNEINKVNMNTIGLGLCLYDLNQFDNYNLYELIDVLSRNIRSLFEKRTC